MVQMTIEMPEEALATLRKDPENFARELRLAAAVKWYELNALPAFQGVTTWSSSQLFLRKALI